MINQQQQIIEELHARMKRYEIVEQSLRDTQARLDAKIDMLDQIHQYTRLAFQQDEKGLISVITEGIVDIFQLEVGAVFSVDYSRRMLVAEGVCNLEDSLAELPLPEAGDWSRSYAYTEQVVTYEVPVSDGIWKPLSLHSIIYMPILDNDRNLRGMIMGGLTEENYCFYDVPYEELKSPFTVFCQQMNGIMNNAEALLKAKAAGMARTRFLANLSHEIRTPMNAINGMLQIAEQSDDHEKMRSCLSTIRSASDQLLSLLNGILDISRIEEDRLTLGYDSFEPKSVITSLVDSFQMDAERKRQKLSVNAQDISQLTVSGDKMRLQQVLSNLLSNALKFTPEGGHIGLDIEGLKRDGNKTLLRFAVTDDGIGIKEELKEQIFVPFEQADGSTLRKYGGTGLGLAISQHIVNLMGGNIRVESKEGIGSAFSFSVWFDVESGPEEADQRAEAAADTYDFTGHTIMVVDDVEINRMIIGAFLEGTNVNLIEAENGEQAIQLFEQSAPGEIAVILMDIQMPVVDGFTASRTIRSLARDDARQVGILAMTANVYQEDIQQALDAGMDAHIGKPVDYGIVMRHLADFNLPRN